MNVCIIKYGSDIDLASLRLNVHKALCSLEQLPYWSEESKLSNQHSKNEFVIIVNGNKVGQTFDKVPEAPHLVNLFQKGSKSPSLGLVIKNKLKYFLPFIVAFLPKCPLCVISYSSAMSLIGIDFFQLNYKTPEVMFFILSLLLLSLGWRAMKTKSSVAFLFGLIGAALIIISYLNMQSGFFYKLGITFIFSGTVCSVFSKELQNWKGRLINNKLSTTSGISKRADSAKSNDNPLNKIRSWLTGK